MSLDKIITSQSFILKEQSPSNSLDINFVMYYDLHSLNVTSVAQSCLTVTPWTAALPASLSITNSRSLLKLTSISSSDIPFSSTFSLSNHQDLSKESVLQIRWSKYWSFSFSISPSNEYSGLISFRIDWFDLLAVQGTCKSLLPHHSSKASFFGSQFSLQSNFHIQTWLLEKPLLWLDRTFFSNVSAF